MNSQKLTGNNHTGNQLYLPSVKKTLKSPYYDVFICVKCMNGNQYFYPYTNFVV